MATTTTTQNDIIQKEINTIEEFYDANKIPYIYFHIGKDPVKKDEEGKPKKLIRGLPDKWQTWSYEKCMLENKKDKGNHNAVSANLRKSDFCIIDIDSEEKMYDLMNKYGDTHWTESYTKGLPHLYRRKLPDEMNCKNVNKKDEGYDIMYTQAFEKIGSELQNWNEEIPTYKSEKKKRAPRKQKEKQYDSTKVSEFDIAILDCIDIKYWENYEHWFKLVSAIVKEKDNMLLADEYSKKAPNYGGIEDVIAKTSNAMQADVTWGTVMYYAKESDPEKYQKIINMYRVDIDLTDMGVAEMILKIKPEDFIYQDNILYYCNGSNPFWLFDDDDNGVKNKIYMDLLDFYNEKNVQIQFKITKISTDIADLERTNKEGKNNEKISVKLAQRDKFIDERDVIEKGIVHSRTTAKLSKYVESLKVKLSQEINKIMFDTLRPYVFCFRNCNIDVRTGERVEIYKKDYITKRVRYDFVEPSKEDCEELEEIIERILPNEDNRKSYMSALWCGLIGKQVEKFVVATGGGRNGKGVINELFEALLTDIYFYTANVTCLTENQKGGANQEIANMDTKRMLLASEPNDSLKLKLGNIKSMTGNSKLNARALYSKKTDVIMQNMTILECNNIPSIEGRIDASASERFMIIEFVSHFTNDETKLKLMKNCYPLDTRYKSDEFKQQFKCVLFSYLLSFGFTDICVPAVVKKRTQKYLVGCDDFLTWFNENYEKSDNKADVVKMKELYDTFKSSDMWDSMPKADRRNKWTKDKMINNIKNNISLGLWFKDRYDKCGVSVRNCLIHHRKRDVVAEE